jgi:hypothetical protein
VRDDHGAAGERQQRLLERAERVHVEVVGGLVQQQQVAAAAEQLREVHAVPLAAGQRAHLALLVRPPEVEPRRVGARVHLAVAHLDLVVAVRDLLPDGLVRVERVARLVHVRELDRIAQPQVARVRLLLADDHAEERGLAGAVRADHADDAGGREAEREVLDQEPVAEPLADVVGLQHHVAQPRPGRDVDLHLVELHALLLGEQRLVAVEAGARLGAAALRGLAHPLELARDRAGARLLAAFLVREPLLLLLEPGGVIALEGEAAAAVELQDPAGHVVEEVAIVGDRDDGALVLLEVLLQPGHRLGVEVVRGLVEEEQVGCRE